MEAKCGGASAPDLTTSASNISDRQQQIKQELDMAATEEFDGSVCSSSWTTGTTYPWNDLNSCSASNNNGNRSQQQNHLNSANPQPYCSAGGGGAGYSAVSCSSSSNNHHLSANSPPWPTPNTAQLQRNHHDQYHHHQRQFEGIPAIDSDSAIQQLIWGGNGDQFNPNVNVRHQTIKCETGSIDGSPDGAADDGALSMQHMEELLYPNRSVKELLLNGDPLISPWDTNHCPNPDANHNYASDQRLILGPDHRLPQEHYGGGTCVTDHLQQQSIFSGEHVLEQNPLVSGSAVKPTVTVTVADPQQQLLAGAAHPSTTSYDYFLTSSLLNDQYAIGSQLAVPNPNPASLQQQSMYNPQQQQQQHRFINPNPNSHLHGANLESDNMQLLHRSALMDNLAYSSAAANHRPYLQASPSELVSANVQSNDLISANLQANLVTAGSFNEANHYMNGFQQQQQPDPYSSLLLHYGALLGDHQRQPTTMLIRHPNQISNANNPPHGSSGGRRSRVLGGGGGSSQLGGGASCSMEVQQEAKGNDEMNMRSGSLISANHNVIRAASSSLAAAEDQKPVSMVVDHQKQQLNSNSAAAAEYNSSNTNSTSNYNKRSRVDQLQQQYRHSQQMNSLMSTSTTNSSMNLLSSGGSGANYSGSTTASSNGSPTAAAAAAANPKSQQVPKKEKLGERITALQQLVAPFGKTDTASVLLEAIGHIRHLQEQVQALSSPYFTNNTPNLGSSSNADQEVKSDLRSRGLCLVPLSCTAQVANVDINGADFWPYIGGAFRS